MKKAKHSFAFRFLEVWVTLLVLLVAYTGFHLYKGTLTYDTLESSLFNFLSTLSTAPTLISIPLFVIAYAIHPLLLLPTSLITMSTVIVFGPKTGWAVAYIGMLASATTAYVLGEHLHERTVSRHHPRIARLLHALHHKFPRHHLFASLVGLRIFPVIPFDIANYFSGVLKINYLLFISATALGIIPLLSLYVFVGKTAAEGRGPYIFVAVIFITIAYKISKAVYSRVKLHHEMTNSKKTA